MQCIYCLIEKVPRDFKSREHVISQFLGKFNPEIYFENELVCKKCNNEDLSKIENIFAEDSFEGIYLAMLNIGEKKTIRTRGERIKIKLSSEHPLTILTKAFPIVDIQTGRIKPRPSFTFTNERGSFQVLWMDEFFQLSKGNRKYREIKKWLKLMMPSMKNKYILGDKEISPDKIIAALHEMDIAYVEKERESFPDEVPYQIKVSVEVDGEIDDWIRRFPCKVAFNYFVYCAKRSSMIEIVYKPEFNHIREFILHGRRPDEKLPIELIREPTLYDERGGRRRRPIHQVSFLAINNKIKAKVSFLGQFNYEIDLGPYKLFTDPKSFGCGHAFDPFNQECKPLDAQPLHLIRQNTFSLFGR